MENDNFISKIAKLPACYGFKKKISVALLNMPNWKENVIIDHTSVSISLEIFAHEH